MPELNFVLPHWMYWGGLILLPLAAFFIHHKTTLKKTGQPVSLSLGYFLLICGGFIGVHRLYLKSGWALSFIILFCCIQIVNVEVREARETHSSIQNQIKIAEFKLERAEKLLREGRRGAQEKFNHTTNALASARQAMVEADNNRDYWDTFVTSLGAVVLLLLLVDAYLLPGLVRQRNQLETGPEPVGFQCPAVEQEHDDSREPFLFNRLVSRLNGTVGELVAYWSIIAVFVYYYEVIARYVFNSPTNWAHESMFLMFGMQYLLAGGYVLREGAHVRVDVIYMHLSKRTRAIIDVVTSVFFFIFMATLLVTGYTFFHDSFEVSEVSFTEWAIQYWPIKFALPLGALLLLLQGVAQLVKDVAVLINPDSAELDTEVRPEG